MVARPEDHDESYEIRKPLRRSCCWEAHASKVQKTVVRWPELRHNSRHCPLPHSTLRTPVPFGRVHLMAKKSQPTNKCKRDVVFAKQSVGHLQLRLRSSGRKTKTKQKKKTKTVVPLPHPAWWSRSDIKHSTPGSWIWTEEVDWWITDILL